MGRYLMIALMALAGFASVARADRAVYLSQHGLAAGGYDVVAYFAKGAAVEGQPSHRILWKGVVWQFGSEANRERFEADPRAYAPRFGGYCAYALAQNQLAKSDPKVGWLIHKGHLYLTSSAEARAALERDPEAFV
ncbi:MAG: YHS domain-containing (seleno)protein [Pseudomonadota bacterium]|nr:YHS domain-containing (seleno)protein [Pseudomonadota bacterium]